MWVLGWRVMPNNIYRTLICGLAVLTVSATVVWAQTDATQAKNSAANAPEESAVGTATTATEPELQPAQTQASPSTKTVLDYEASEQISEDFSVSFPVDI